MPSSFPPPPAGEEAFDTVDLTTDRGEVRRLTPDQFRALPLDERVKSILRKRLKFFRSGSEVPLNEAIRRY